MTHPLSIAHLQEIAHESPVSAAAVVFLASGAVLVLEIVGLRLVAPYVG